MVVIRAVASLLPIPYTVPPLSVISVLGFNDCRCLNCFRLFPRCDYIISHIAQVCKMGYCTSMHC